MVDNFKFEHVISLGVDCRVSFQASRFFGDTRATPPETQVGATEAGESIGVVGKHLFDWNIVWFSDVIRLFGNDFEGIFDKDLLRPMPNDVNVAIDGTYGLRYFHSFRAEPSQSFAEMVAAQYGDVAPKILYLVEKLKKHLAASNPTLYVRCDGSEAEAARFCQTIKALHPAHCFHLILIDTKEETAGFTVRHDEYSIYQMAKHVRKPASAAWSGDDEEWTAMFRQASTLLAPPSARPIGPTRFRSPLAGIGKILATLHIPRTAAAREARTGSGRVG